MVSVILPYIKSAREGVERLGKIVEKKVLLKLMVLSSLIKKKFGIWR